MISTRGGVTITDFQSFSYLQRLEGMNQVNFGTLVRHGHAYVEQRNLELTWFFRLKSVRNITADQSSAGTNWAAYCSPQAIRERSRQLLKAQWNLERTINKKLEIFTTPLKSVSERNCIFHQISPNNTSKGSQNFG